MSPGWSDVYGFTLPGQEIDISDLPDGLYRFWAQADPDGWFTEASEDNNLTWSIIELSGCRPMGQGWRSSRNLVRHPKTYG